MQIWFKDMRYKPVIVIALEKVLGSKVNKVIWGKTESVGLLPAKQMLSCFTKEYYTIMADDELLSKFARDYPQPICPKGEYCFFFEV